MTSATIDPFLLGAPVMRTLSAPPISLAPDPAPSTPLPATGNGASETFSRSVQLALLSLLAGPAADRCIEGLRRLGAMGPHGADYLALERDGLAQRGVDSGLRLLTPRGRAVAGNVAIEVASRTRAHRAVFGVDQKTREVYFRCSCGINWTEPYTGSTYRRVRASWQAHRDQIADKVRTAPMAQGAIEDAHAMMTEQIQGFIRQTQGGNRG